ncbi:hypothetical protein LL972_17170 [Xanthomonas campestris pv. asclepiadis]|uniref:hypothetical protein n=1 Tax=Xanthomonas campestris TaxID=339 RepID=UPI001E5E6805|nr:hypothetical protein [Xanthomonas campestris]MCC4617708.1 hypothetical protein [Xanthomonas campestris pv. asclepiadis]
MEDEQAAHCAALFVDGLAWHLAHVSHACNAAGASIAPAVIVGLDAVHAPPRDCSQLWPLLCQATRFPRGPMHQQSAMRVFNGDNRLEGHRLFLQIVRHRYTPPGSFPPD